MTGCEYHDQYREYLREELIKLAEDGRHGDREWSNVWGVAHKTAIFRNCNSILPEDAEAILAEIFRLYPQYEKTIKAELAEQFPQMVEAHL